MPPLWKQKTPRDKKFLQWLLTRPCELRRGRHGPCGGEMIYHHTEGGGIALKGDDYAAISVCFLHHKLFDNATKKGIGIFYGDRLPQIIERNKRQYVEQGHKLKEG